MQINAPRDCTRNAGYLSTTQVAEDLYVAGAIIVTVTEGGELGVQFIAESLDEVPIPEVQEALGQMVTTAWRLANNPGFEPPYEGEQ